MLGTSHDITPDTAYKICMVIFPHSHFALKCNIKKVIKT